MTISSSILAGNRVRFSLAFRNDAGVLVDPTVVTCRVGLDTTSGVSLAVVRDSLGLYHADWDTTSAAAGIYYAVGEGTGALIAARELRLTVRLPHLV